MKILSLGGMYVWYQASLCASLLTGEHLEWCTGMCVST